MSKIIEQFINDHNQIITNFKHSLTLQEDPHAFKIALIEIKELLINHLQNEDKELYTELNKIGESNEEVKATIAMFTTDIQFATERFLIFISQLDNDADLTSLSDQYLDLVSLIDRRIDREEIILFKLYEKYCT